jgi:D-glycero-alpha-D-manno-heptose-7-phosphate kinase
MDAYRGRNRRVVEALDRMRALAEAMARVLEGGDLDDLGRMVGEHWIYQRSLHPAITTARIESIMERAARAGALGAKALGASGGGCVLVMVPLERRQAVAGALADLGELLDARIDTSGLTVRATDLATRTGNERRAG